MAIASERVRARLCSAHVLSIFVAASLASVAHADGRVTAQALFDEGRRLMTAGDIARACANFAESMRLDPAAGTLMNLAACHERAGKTATAWVEFHEARAEGERDGREDRVDEANRRIADLEPRLARVTIEVAAPAPAIEVFLDGDRLGRASWGVPLPIDPGRHELRATSPGRDPWIGRIEAAVGAPARITVPRLAETARPAGLDADVVREGGERQNRNDRPARTTAVAATLWALGAATTGVGAYFGVVAIEKEHESHAPGNCVLAGCTARGAALVRDANRAAWAANVSIGIGLTAVAIATVVFLVSPRRSITPPLPAHVDLSARFAATAGPLFGDGFESASSSGTARASGVGAATTWGAETIFGFRGAF